MSKLQLNAESKDFLVKELFEQIETDAEYFTTEYDKILSQVLKSKELDLKQFRIKDLKHFNQLIAKKLDVIESLITK